MTDSKALIERLRADWPEILVEKHWMMDSDAIEEQRREAADHIEKLEAELDRCRKSNAVMDNTVRELEADKARLNDALRQAVMDAAEWARKAGEAQGKLEISEAAGILDGWIRDCEQLRADKALLREALIRIDGHYTDNPCATAEEADRLTIEEMAQMARAALQETSHDA